MKRKFVIKGHYSQPDNEKYYTIEQKILGIFSSDYIVPVFYSESNDCIVVYDNEYSFSDPDKAVDVLQKLEEFYELGLPEVQIAWDHTKDTYVYIPKNNLSTVLGYDEIINKDHVFSTPLRAYNEYYEGEEHKKSWIEKIVTFENGKIC